MAFYPVYALVIDKAFKNSYLFSLGKF